MTYLKRSNIALKRSRTVTASIVIFLAMLFGLHFLFPKFYSTIFYPITSIAWSGKATVGDWFSNIGSLVRSKYSLSEENQRLWAQIEANQSSMLLLNLLQAENDSLKGMLGRVPEGANVLSVVLSRPPVSLYDTLILDRGEKNGVKVGDKIYADGDILVGEIAEVYSKESKAALFSTPGKKTRVAFVGSDIETEATGKGGGNFTANVPVDSGVKEGDTVTIPGIKPHTLGIVEKATNDPADSFSTVLFKMPVNVSDISFVTIHIEK